MAAKGIWPGLRYRVRHVALFSWWRANPEQSGLGHQPADAGSGAAFRCPEAQFSLPDMCALAVSQPLGSDYLLSLFHHYSASVEAAAGMHLSVQQLWLRRAVLL